MADDLDQLIDGALAEYANPEPLAGLEQRIVARARSSRSRRWWWGAALVPAAIVLAVTVQPKPVATLAIEWPAPPAPVLTARNPIKRSLTVAARSTARHSPVKRPTFPSLSPLTDEERLLVELAKSRPEQLLYRPPEVIEVKPIEIAPLESDGSH